MTEKSYFFASGATGDQVLSPYNQLEFNPAIMQPAIGNTRAAPPLYYQGQDPNQLFFTDMYVVPDYLDNLDPRAIGLGFHSVEIMPGAAAVGNKYYVLNEATTLPIALPASGYHRFDYVVVEQVAATNKVRLQIVQGPEVLLATYLTLPTLTYTTTVRQYPLARVYVTSAFAYIPEEHVHDYRHFLYTSRSPVDNPTAPPNLLTNGSWMDANTSPAGWETAGTYTLGYNAAYGENNSIGISPTTDTTLSQWVQVGGTRTFTLTFGTTVTSELTTDFTIGIRGYRENGVESAVSKSQRYNKFAPFIDIGNITITFPEDDIAYLYVYITIDSTTANVILYPVTLREGFYHGIPEFEDEIILLTTTLTDAGWSATAKSSGTTTINLITSFGTIVENNVRAVILRVRGRDSGSAAAANCYMRIQGYVAPYNSLYGVLQLEGETNDVWREIQVIVPVNIIYTKTEVAGAQFRIVIAASGAATFDATIEVVGLLA